MPNMSFTNNAATTLAAGITNVATSLTVGTGTGALFPTLAGAQYFYCTLNNNAGAIEIVKVTARSTDTFTIVRAQDNTTAAAWSLGDKVELRLVAAELNNFPKLDEANTFSGATTLSATATMSGAAFNEAVPVTVASATSTAIGAAASNTITISGSTTITSFDTVASGIVRRLTFTGTPTLTYNATSLILPTSNNIIVTVGDTATFLSLGSGNWRCLDYQRANGTAVREGSKIQNISASVAASALTLQLNPTVLDFRSATLATSTINSRTVASAITLTVPSTATLGTTNAVASRLIVLAIDNAGTVELAVVNNVGATALNLDETNVISTTAISTAADSAGVIYSTTARTNVPYRVVGFVDSTQATAGTWATAPSTIQGWGGNIFNSISPQTTKAWVNFNGTGTPAIRVAYNVSSITDNAVGNYTVNFTTAMPDANYAYSATSADDDTSNIWNNQAASSSVAGYITTTSLRIGTTVNGAQADTTIATVAIFR